MKDVVHIIGHKNPDTDSHCIGNCICTAEAEAGNQCHCLPFGRIEPGNGFCFEKVSGAGAGVYSKCKSEAV